MPRRPRPASRRSGLNTVKTNASTGRTPARPVKSNQIMLQNSEGPSSSSQSEAEENEDEEDDSSLLDEDLKHDEASDVDPEAARVSQWVDEEELGEVSDEESEEEPASEEEEAAPALGRVQRDHLASLPLGALRKAQQALAKAAIVHSSDEESDGNSDAEEEAEFDRQEGSSKQVEEAAPKDKREIPKRKNKHAPTEVTSKRPVPRKRLPEAEKRIARDPRFVQLSGEFNPQKFQNQYGFLADMHQDEAKTLKENLKRARKLLASSPYDLRAEREQEVQRLERAVKRAESTVNRDRQDKVAQEALRTAKKEEQDKRKGGKSAWYMKDSDKKALLLKAKYDALSAEGGKGAVRKAIERKQKKVSQKEKKRRPDGPRQRDADGGPGGKRPRAGETAGAPRKRQRLQ